MRQSLFLKLRLSQAQQPNNLSMLSLCASLSARRNARNHILKDDGVVRSHWKLTTAFGSQRAGRLAFRTVLHRNPCRADASHYSSQKLHSKPHTQAAWNSQLIICLTIS